MSKVLSRYSRLIPAMHHAALTALAKSPNGQLHINQIMQAIESTVELDGWAYMVYDNGNTRWRSILRLPR